MNRPDDERDIRYGDAVVADMRRNNIRRQRDARFGIFHVVSPLGSASILSIHDMPTTCLRDKGCDAPPSIMKDGPDYLPTLPAKQAPTHTQRKNEVYGKVV